MTTGGEPAYEPRPLSGGACLPPASAATTADGAVLPFVVPYDSIAERPLVLVLEAAGGSSARIELDV